MKKRLPAMLWGFMLLWYGPVITWATYDVKAEYLFMIIAPYILGYYSCKNNISSSTLK